MPSVGWRIGNPHALLHVLWDADPPAGGMV